MPNRVSSNVKEAENILKNIKEILEEEYEVVLISIQKDSIEIFVGTGDCFYMSADILYERGEYTIAEKMKEANREYVSKETKENLLRLLKEHYKIDEPWGGTEEEKDILLKKS